MIEPEQFKILIVDDEESLREVLTIMLHREGYHVKSAADGAQALVRLNESRFDLIVSDIKMPKVNGIDLLKEIKERHPETLVMMITAFSSTEEAVEAMRQGAYDYITKPFQNDEIRLLIRNALEKSQLLKENTALKAELGQRLSFGSLIGKSRRMQEIYTLIERVADSRTSILITGESGTGKELVAKAIHHNSPRRDKVFVPINCGAIPENLLESELFGHEKGSFTGATQSKQGLFEIASEGTLFLDEIGELPMPMQVKLLRVLQEQELRRVGGTRNLKVNVRVVAATNKDLDVEVRDGRFREDLYYRLNVIHLDLPPLRERKDDIPELVKHFLVRYAGESPPLISEKLMQMLIGYDWPGNIRELENTIERCVVLGRSDELSEDCLPAQILQKKSMSTFDLEEFPEEGLDLDAYLADIEKRLLQLALDKAGGVRKQAATLLGVTFRSMRYRLAKLGLEAEGREE